MVEETIWWAELPGGRIGVDTRTGAIRSARAADDSVPLLESEASAGLLRLAFPIEGYPSHYAELGTHGAPTTESRDGALRLTYSQLSTPDAIVAVRTEVDLTATTDGLVLRCRVRNDSDQSIPQVAFPQVLGLQAVAGTADTRLQLGRRRMLPFEELAMRVDDARYLDLDLQEYIGYGALHFNMKWLDYGSSRSGLTLFSRGSRYTAQGLVVDRPDRSADVINLHWAHYPGIAPGETWESEEYVLLPHAGDWYAGARAYQRFTDTQYAYHAPQHIREALGIRSVWPAVRNAPPTFRMDELASYAEEIADPDLGLAELVLWHWWLKNGYPMILDDRLGTEAEFEGALKACQAIGVPVSAFVSHKILRDTEETDPEWLHLNAAGQKIADNWTYGRDFLPKFGVLFMGTHAMVQGSALSRGWRETGLAEYRRLMDRGATSICFDVFRAWYGPNTNPSIDGRPDEEGDKLIEFAHQARELIHQANPTGTFSGEYVTDLKVPVLDYTWEWRNAFHLADAAPFRYVFPQFRLNANVGEHPRGALIAFMEGALLNVIPGQMNSHRLADHPDLVAVLRSLASMRRRFLDYFTEGQFHFLEGLRPSGCDARLYTHDGRILVIALNPQDVASEASIVVDPSTWGARTTAWTVTGHDLAGDVVQEPQDYAAGTPYTMTLGPDGIRVMEFVPRTAVGR